MWKCSKCKRSFLKMNQSHSCKVFPLSEHFRKKEHQKEFFDAYIDFIRNNIGDFKIEALPCCIHLVSNYTFGAVWIYKDKLKIDFMLSKQVNSKKIIKIDQPSPNRFVHYMEISSKNDLDNELIEWIKEAYFLKY